MDLTESAVGNEWQLYVQMGFHPPLVAASNAQSDTTEHIGRFEVFAHGVGTGIFRFSKPEMEGNILEILDLFFFGDFFILYSGKPPLNQHLG